MNYNAGVVNNLLLYDNTDEVGRPDTSENKNGEQSEISSKIISPQDVDAASYDDAKGSLKIKIHRADIYKNKDGFDSIIFKRTTVKAGKIPLFFMPTAEFGYEEKSKYHDDYKTAEEEAAKKKKGLHSTKAIPLHRVNDISRLKNKPKLLEAFNFLKQ